MNLDSVRSFKSAVSEEVMAANDGPGMRSFFASTEPPMPPGMALGVSKRGDEHVLTTGLHLDGDRPHEAGSSVLSIEYTGARLGHERSSFPALGGTAFCVSRLRRDPARGGTGFCVPRI